MSNFKFITLLYIFFPHELDLWGYLDELETQRLLQRNRSTTVGEYHIMLSQFQQNIINLIGCKK